MTKLQVDSMRFGPWFFYRTPGVDGDKQQIEVMSATGPAPATGAVIVVDGRLERIRENLSDYEITATSWKAASP